MERQRFELDAAIERLLGKNLREKLHQHVLKEELGLVSRKAGLPRTRLSELLHRKRPLSLYYLIKLLDSGVITMKELLKGVDLVREPIGIVRYIRLLARLEDEDMLKDESKRVQEALSRQSGLRDRMLQAFMEAPDRLSDALRLLGY